MTIVSTGSPAFVIIQGSGASIYTFPFKAFPSETDSAIYGINVWLQDANGSFALQTQGAGADYTVTTTSSSAESGTITFKVAVPTTKKVFIFSACPYTQTGDFSSANAAVAGPALEKALDRLATQIRQVNRDIAMTLRLEVPPEIWPMTLLVDPVITDGATVYWQKDTVQPSTYHLKTSDFKISDLKALVEEVEQAVTQTQAAAATAQAAANNAALSSQSAANAVSQLNTSITQIIADLNAVKTQAEGIKLAIQVLDDEIKGMRDVVVDARDQALNALTAIQALVAKFPDPAGKPVNLTYVTDGAGKMVFQPYTPIIGITTASEGQVITVHAGANGNELIASSPITTSEKVGTFAPVDEGGTTVSAALLNHQNRLDFIENTADIFPYGKQHVIADFIVNADGNLRSGVDSTVITRLDAVNVKYQQFGDRIAYWTSGNNFTLPATINSKPLILNTHTMMFGIYVDSNMPDTVIFSNTAFTIKKVANNIQFIHGTVTVNLPLTVNQWVFYCLTLSGASSNPSLGGHTAQFNAGTITVTDITPTPLVSTIPNNQDISVNMETNLRLVRLAFIDQVVTKDEFQTWVAAIYGIAIGKPGVPDPANGQNGQAIVVDSGAYALKAPLLLDPIAAGYNVDNTMEISAATATGEYVLAMDINTTTKAASFKPVQLNFDIVTNAPAGWTIVDKVNATTDLAATGLYNWYFDVNATAKTITLKVSKMNPPTTLKTTIFTAAPTPATPQQLIGDNNNAVNRFIQNETGYDIVVGTQAELAANDDQGITIRSGNEYSSKANRAMFVRFPVGATALPADAAIKIIEEVLV